MTNQTRPSVLNNNQEVVVIRHIPPPSLNSRSKRSANPYSIKRSNMVQIHITNFLSFIKIVNGHINTMLRHDPDKNLQPGPTFGNNGSKTTC